jgi:hypothetical protein
MVRGPAIVLLLAALGQAPFQCSSEPDPDLEIEETPGEALYKLAGKFRKAGDRAAWRTTLRYLIAQYPSSRFAEMARQDLEEEEGDGGGPVRAK